MRKKRILLPIFSFFIFLTSVAQDKWDLRRCVEYAWQNNIDVRLADVNARMAAIDLEQSRWETRPVIGLNTNIGLQFGRSIDPNTNQFTSGSSMLLYNSFNLQGNIDFFAWGRLKNAVISYQYSHQSALANVDKVKNDVALNVATAYLTALLNHQQAEIARVTMEQSRYQLILTRRKVDAGSLPEIDALTFETQYTTDSANYIGAMATAQQSLLSLKALLNLDAAQPFEIETPPVDNIPIEPLLQLQPELVFETALNNQPAQKQIALQIKSAEAMYKSRKALFYPTFSLFGSLASQFSSSDRKITGYQFLGYSPADPLSPIVNVGGVAYPVLSPNVDLQEGKKTFSEMWDGWGRQIDNSFRQAIGLSIQVPIMQRGFARLSIKTSKLQLENLSIQRQQVDQTLKNNIYTAFYQATAALQKYNATVKSVETAQKSYDFALKRFDMGLLNAFELLNTQNNLTRAKLDNLYAQFDYVFKMKVLEFWKGLGIRL
jgi:outer membrane protein